MASKKYMLVLALAGLFQTASFAQTKTSDASDSWVLDSSKVSTKSAPQYNEFKNNEYPYPAMPRDQWELGISGGAGYLMGDTKSDIGITGGLSLRKSLGHIISARASWEGSLLNGSKVGTKGYDYKSAQHVFSIDGIASLNTLSWYRGNPKTNWYALLGYSLVMNQTRIKTASGDYHIYHDEDQRSLITTAFGTAVHSNVTGHDSKSQWFMHGIDLGGGFAFKISEKINFGIEQKFVLLPMDQIDAYKGGKSNDILSYSTLRLNINMGNTSKKVAPLWWINPNNYVYNEVNTPKHMKIPTPVLPDADGDGVTDQFDQEPNTPAGAPVDSHGKAKDTDGDGVPDYKDKEILTPQSCFPVNADGVGTCPEPACCKELRDMLKNYKPTDCAITSLPSIQFKGSSVTISSSAASILASAAQQLNANPTCKVKVVGYGASNKRAQQLSWDRVNAVIKYLVEKQGISETRFIFTYGQEGDPNTVDLQPTTEEGPNVVPAPHPQYKQTK